MLLNPQTSPPNSPASTFSRHEAEEIHYDNTSFFFPSRNHGEVWGCLAKSTAQELALGPPLVTILIN